MVSLAPVERDTDVDWGEFTARRSVIHRFRHDRVALVASVLLLALIMICALAPVTAPYSPYKIDPANLFAPPGSPGHLLGTDNEGRDMLSRLIWGGRVSLVTGIVPVVIGLVVGGAIGLLAGFKGGAARTAIMRAMDVFLAFPAVLLAIAIAMTLGPGTRNLIIALSVVLIPAVARVTDSASTSACSQEYMEAARASGAPSRTIIFVQLWKNAASPPLAYCFSIVGPVIVFAAGLNYLGLGVQPPVPEWGSMLYGMQSSLLLAPTQAILPGAPIAIVALLFDLIGNAVRDVLDPRQV
jgi:peptide/nickel transport system permease protein